MHKAEVVRTVRTRLIMVGYSLEAIELIPMLESNPEVELLALVTDQPEELRKRVSALDRATALRLAPLIATDLPEVLRAPDITAAIDAGASLTLREQLAAVPGLHVTTPLLAQLLYAFGPAHALSKTDLLLALREVLDTYNLTLDRRELLSRVLQIAVAVTGADRGSLMLWDERERVLRVSVSRGIEPELISKIRVKVGEGIAGRAFATQQAILLHGKANQTSYEIVRERDDVESAISAPLLHDGAVIGVLNLSHAKDQEAFSQEDLYFVRDLAQLDAKLIARADVYQGLMEESEALRIEVQVHRLVSGSESLSRRLEEFCSFAASGSPGSVCRLYLRDPQLDSLVLQASSSGLDPFTSRRRVSLSEGIAGHVAATQRPVLLRASDIETPIAYSALPMMAAGELLGVLELEGGDAASGPHAPGGRLAAVADALAAQLCEILELARVARRVRRAESVSDLFAALTLQPSQEESYRLVTSSTAAIFEAEDVALRILDPTSGDFQIVSWSGIGQGRQGRAQALEAKLSSQAIASRRVLRIGELASDGASKGEWAADEFGFMCAMSHPLQHAGELVGCLTVLGLVPAEPVLGQTYQLDDEAFFTRLAEQVQVALFALAPASEADTGRRSAELSARIEEEIARSQHVGRQFALLQLSFDGLEPLLRALPKADGERLIRDLQGALAGGLRSFDVLVQTGDTTFRALVPDPDGDAATLLVSLTRRATYVLEAQSTAATAVRVRAGYAIYPTDGDSVDALLSCASSTGRNGAP